MDQILRVLMVEDSEDDASLILRVLRREGYDVVCARVDTLVTMRAALENRDGDVIISDYAMPHFSVPFAISVLKKANIDIPLIVVTGTVGEETAAECMRLGAHDYIMKGNLSRLCPAIERELKEVQIRKRKKQMEEALRKAELDWQATFDATSDAICLLDNNQRILRCNRTMADMFGMKQEEFIGRHCWEVMHGKMEPIPECPLIRMKSSLVRETMDLQRGDMWFNVTVDPMLDDTRTIQSVVHIVRDITERKQVEEALRESASMLQVTIDDAPVCVAMIDLDKRFLKCNKAFCTFLGYSEKEMQQKTITDVTFQDDLEIGMADLRAIVAGEKKISVVQKRYVRKDKEVVWGEVNINLIRNNQGQPLYFLPIIIDITERVKAEEEVWESHSKLQRNLKGCIDVISETIEVKGPYAHGHNQRVEALACAIAREMGLTSFQVQGVKMAAAVYNIGLIKIPTEILLVGDHLNGPKLTIYQSYPQTGHDTLKKLDFSWPIADITLQHRECFDGSGFPQGLKGESILIEARIIAIADAIEDFTSNNINRPAMDMEEALAVIENHSGSKYDPEAVDACLKLFKEKGYTMGFTKLITSNHYFYGLPLPNTL